MSASNFTNEVVSSSESINVIAAEQRQQLKSLSLNRVDDDVDGSNKDNGTEETTMIAILTLQDITEIPPTSMEGKNETHRSTTIPKVKFIDDITQYIESFTPKVVTSELLIGAYTQLHTKYKLSETSLLRKRK